jgi:hypothetical protein
MNAARSAELLGACVEDSPQAANVPANSKVEKAAPARLPLPLRGLGLWILDRALRPTRAFMIAVTS